MNAAVWPMRALLALLIVSGMVSPAPGQTNRGSIAGTVTDPHGGAIVGASVTIINAGTNQTTRVKTSSTGSYTTTDLEPVLYSIEVEAPGFKKELIRDVKVDTASITTTDVHMQVGQTNQTVSINADTPLVNADESAPGTTIAKAEIEDAPLADRFVLSLALTVPNVSGMTTSEEVGVFQTTISPGVGLNMNGSRPGEGAFLADGVNNTGVGMSRAVVTFSPDTVQEFKVSTSNFSAEYGATGGGVVNVTTRSGTNQFHGTFAWYNRNPLYNAIPFTDSSVRPPSQLKVNNGVATFSGPIWIPKLYHGRNKSFFFFAVEPKYRYDGVNQTSIVPTAAQRTGDLSNTVNVNGTYVPLSVAQQFGLAYTPVILYNQFAQVGNQFTQLASPAAGQTYTPFPNNVIPASTLDPTSQKILAQGMPPAGTWFLNSGVPQNFSYFRSVKSVNDQITLRLDHRLSDKNSLYGRWTTVPNRGDRPRGFFGDSSVNQYPTWYSASQQGLIGNTYIFTPTLVNDLRLNVLRGNYTQTNAPPWQTQNWSTQLGLPAVTQGGVPLFNFSTGGMFAVGQNNITGNGDLSLRVETSYNIADTLTWNRGNMSIKFGTDLRRMLLNQQDQAYATSGSYRFQNTLTNSGGSNATGGWDYATFLLGVPNSVSLQSSVIPYYYRWSTPAFFVQDDWKVTPNFTLNLGLRYSIDFPRTEKYNDQAVIDPSLAITVLMPAQLLNTNGTPYTGLPSSLIPTTTLEPVLAFVGKGGRSPYLYPPDYKEFQPRAGFAWRPKIFGLNSGERAFVLRGGYGLTNLPVTGNNRTPNPDFSQSAQTYSTTSGQTNPAYVMRLSSNPPVLTPQPAPVALLPANGIVTDALAYQSTAYEIAPNFRTPYSQSWSLSIQKELTRNMVLEVGYQGNKGTHLFFPALNNNLVPFNVGQQVDALNVNLRTVTVQDPLGRRVNPFNPNSAIINVPLGSALAPYAGFTQLYERYLSEANSIRHAGYISLQRRFQNNLTVRVNYTFQKTITDASDNGLCTDCMQGSQIWTQISYGATYAQERSVAAFNQPHVISSTFTYQFPFGRGETFLSNAPRWLNTIVGGWKLSGVGTMMSGTPFVTTIYDDNGLGTVNAGSGQTVVRANIVPGVPLKNPNWSSSCEYGPACGPYLNPAAFERPPQGQLGDAPSVLPWVYAPMQKNLDLSLIKNINFGEKHQKTIQLRLDAFNALNYRGFRISGTNSFNSAYIVNAPSTADLTTAAYNTWATAWDAAHPNDQAPLQVSGQPNNPTYQQVVNLTAAPRAANGGVLPTTFYSVPLPANLAGLSTNSFDIRTLNGLKDYQLRSVYNTSWATLSDPANARYLQISVRFTF